jgi:fibronectin-binding autotransporter adhesin
MLALIPFQKPESMKPKNHSLRHFLSLVFTGSAIFASQATLAGTITWNTADATTTSWALGTNWVGGNAPVAGDDVVVSADGTFDPTNNSGYTGIAINSLTLTGAQTLTLSSAVQVGAGGVWNTMTVNSLNLKAVNLTADQTWGGTRTIFVQGPLTGSKMTFDGSGIRFDVNSPNWAGGLDVRTSVNMASGGFDPGPITPFGTGTITLINQRSDGSTASAPILRLAAKATNDSVANANTIANAITLSDPSTSNFTITQGNDAIAGNGHYYILSGDITGAVNSARTLSFTNTHNTPASTPATFILTGANSYAAQTTIGSNTTLQIGNGETSGTLGSGTGTISNSGTLAFNRSDALSVTNIISGAGGQVQQLGAGTTTLSGNNSYTGATIVSAGVLRASHANALGTTAAGTSVASGAALEIIGGISIGVEDLTLDGDGISAGGALRNISGNNNHAGTITLNGATRINSDSGRLTLSGGFSGAQNLTIGGAGAITISGDLALGTGTLTKDGAGVLTLSAAGTRSGTTTVSDGTLLINGDQSTAHGTVTVEDGATLGGGGIIGGHVNVSTAGTISPGNSAGNLTLNNGLTLAGLYLWELGALSTANPGSNFDTITITTGNADITGAALGLNLGGFAPSAVPFWQTDQTWTAILNNTGTGTLDGAFTITTDQTAWASLGAFTTTTTSGSNDVNLVWTAVPEPGSSILVGGFGMLALLRRRRNQGQKRHFGMSFK